MNVYQAIIRAADQIESQPASFDFWKGAIPRDCGTPGCALGWIAFFAGHAAGSFNEGCVPLRVKHRYTFYNRMTALETGADIRDVNWANGSQWVTSATQCACLLRLYAEKYHGHEKPVERNFAQEQYAIAACASLPEYVHG